MIPVRAEIAQVENISAHADYTEILNWLAHLKKAPHKLFITHGGIDAAEALKSQIEQRFHWKCEIPAYLDSEILWKDSK